jgi:hypothetical protein
VDESVKEELREDDMRWMNGTSFGPAQADEPSATPTRTPVKPRVRQVPIDKLYN